MLCPLFCSTAASLIRPFPRPEGRCVPRSRKCCVHFSLHLAAAWYSQRNVPCTTWHKPQGRTDTFYSSELDEEEGEGQDEDSEQEEDEEEGDEEEELEPAPVPGEFSFGSIF